MEAILFSEDGRATGDRRAIVGIDPESWDELLPFIHSIYLRVDAPPTSPRGRDREQEWRDSAELEVRCVRTRLSYSDNRLMQKDEPMDGRWFAGDELDVSIF
jgi:hypothetical protein